MCVVLAYLILKDLPGAAAKLTALYAGSVHNKVLAMKYSEIAAHELHASAATLYRHACYQQEGVYGTVDLKETALPSVPLESSLLHLFFGNKSGTYMKRQLQWVMSRRVGNLPCSMKLALACLTPKRRQCGITKWPAIKDGHLLNSSSLVEWTAVI